jgi:hypothetical protein
MSSMGGVFVLNQSSAVAQLGAVSSFVRAVAANACGARMYGATSISPALKASAMLVSSAKNLIEILRICGFPPQYLSLATSSTPCVGSKLATRHGPVPIVSVPGCP